MQNSYWQDLLPMALECGMSPTQFWEGEPRLIKSYLIKHELELDEFNYKSWLSNLYNYKATLSAILQTFGDKDKLKKEDIIYFEKPLNEFFRNKNLTEQNDKKINKENINKDYRKKVNYWAKFGKKGG